MLAWDEDNSNSCVPTSFDEERIKELQIGETVDGELGNWKVSRNKKNTYIVLLTDGYQVFEFREPDEIFDFLKSWG